MATQIVPDIQIKNGGGMGFFIISAETAKGRRWLKRNVPSQDEGTAYCDDRRYAMDIAEGAIDAGLEVR